MLASIHPLGERARHQHFAVTAIAYAVGSVINSDRSVDAVLVEIDLTALASYATNLASVPIVSIVTNNITNYVSAVFPCTNLATAITTDGVDLYVAVEGPGEGNPNDRQPPSSATERRIFTNLKKRSTRSWASGLGARAPSTRT